LQQPFTGPRSKNILNRITREPTGVRISTRDSGRLFFVRFFPSVRCHSEDVPAKWVLLWVENAQITVNRKARGNPDSAA
jgi:hypothetical protein